MQWRKENMHSITQIQAGIWKAGRVTMANLGEWSWGRGRRGSWKAKISFRWGISITAEIPEFLLHMSKKCHRVCWRWLDLLQYGIRLFELWDFSHPGAGNIPETTSPSLFPLAALILLCHCSPASSAIYCCKPILFARSKSALKANLSGKADSAVLRKKKRIWWGRRESRLVCYSHSYFGSVFITISPENWKWDPKEELGGGRENTFFHWLQDL